VRRFIAVTGRSACTSGGPVVAPTPATDKGAA
jgi:hypothetical protein